MIELNLHLRCQWVWILFDHRNVRHALRVQLLLHFGCWQSWVESNVELLQTGFQFAAADRVHDQRKLRRVCLPVCRPVYACISSHLETKELGVVAEVCPEVEARRAVDAAVTEHNSLCVTRSPDDDLQVFRAEVDAIKENFFCDPRSCLRERVDVELRFYSGEVVYKPINCEKFEFRGSAVDEEAGEVCVCVWNIVYSNSVEVGQPESGSHAVFHQWFMLFVVETDLEVETGDVWDLVKIKFERIKIMKLCLLSFINLLEWVKQTN